MDNSSLHRHHVCVSIGLLEEEKTFKIEIANGMKRVNGVSVSLPLSLYLSLSHACACVWFVHIKCLVWIKRIAFLPSHLILQSCRSCCCLLLLWFFGAFAAICRKINPLTPLLCLLLICLFLPQPLSLSLASSLFFSCPCVVNMLHAQNFLDVARQRAESTKRHDFEHNFNGL